MIRLGMVAVLLGWSWFGDGKPAWAFVLAFLLFAYAAMRGEEKVQSMKRNNPNQALPWWARRF